MCLDEAMETPLALSEAHEKWTAGNSPEQLPMSWNLDKWIKCFPEHREFLTELNSKALNRAEVARLGEEVTSEKEAIKLFLASMIWGFGNAGYGPFRTRRILDTHSAGAKLLEIAQIANEDGGLAAFKHVANKRADCGYLKYLGPAFGTKYIYFAQMAKQPKKATPVMDAVIRRWFAANIPGMRLNLSTWDLASYEKYIQHLTHWAVALSPGNPLRLDQIEYLIFAGQRTNWPSPTELEAELTVLELIDRLKAHAETTESITAEATQLLDRLEELFGPTIEQSQQN
jgi:hypothetical protein